jgi:hypothetical protein
LPPSGLGERELEAAWDEGSTLALEQAIAYALEEDVDGRVDGGVDTSGR